jgi:hypothetical protein
MVSKSAFILLAAFGFVGASAAPIVLSGTTQNCVGGTPVIVVGVGKVYVSAFNKTKTPTLVSLLRTMDTTAASTGAGMTNFVTKYRQMVSLTKTSNAIARVTSDSNGKFAVSTSPVDSVLMVAYADNEDQPFFYSYAMIGGRASSSFVLDMSRGGCFR